MDDLISRQAVLDAFHTWFADGFNEDRWWNSTHVLAAIEALPSAQPEIIRCKDCKWWSNDEYRECSSPNYDDGYVTPAGFYCGWAERRKDG